MAYERPQTRLPEPEPVEQPPMVTPLRRLGDREADVDCPYCRQVTRTRVVKIAKQSDSLDS